MHPLLDFERDGAELFPGAAADVLNGIRALLPEQPIDRAGLRLHHVLGLNALLASDGIVGRIARAKLTPTPRPVRALLFDKRPEANWALGWHQDRTICVRERIEIAGFAPWTRKQGMHHVAPPFELLARMVTLRIHLDDVEDDNAPLLIALGSHKFGRVPVSDVDRIVARCGTHACLAIAGDVWAYATPILHASGAASKPANRRVLQVDYSADTLPGGLEWLGI